MELDPKTISRVWWKGALSSAVKGIPQGLMLGAIGFAALTLGIFALGVFAPTFAATWLAAPFGPFLFASTPAVTTALAAQTLPALAFASFNPLPVIALNTVLTAVGNFLTGGSMAVNAYKQDIEHRMNEARITHMEQRQLQVALPAPARSQAVGKILANGPRNATNFEHAEDTRATQASEGPTIH